MSRRQEGGAPVTTSVTTSRVLILDRNGNSCASAPCNTLAEVLRRDLAVHCRTVGGGDELTSAAAFIPQLIILRTEGIDCTESGHRCLPAEMARHADPAVGMLCARLSAGYPNAGRLRRFLLLPISPRRASQSRTVFAAKVRRYSDGWRNSRGQRNIAFRRFGRHQRKVPGGDSRYSAHG